MNKKLESFYKAAQEDWVKTVGLKAGDTVKVVSKARSYQLGWGNVWVEEMDEAVGRTTVVSRINPTAGITLKVNFCDYPFFVLEKVSKPVTTVANLMSGKYDATVGEEEIVVGSETISFEKFDELVKAVNKFRS